MTPDTSRDTPQGLPKDETEKDSSLTPTKATTDPATAAEEEREIDSDAALSPAAEQGASALANIGKPNGSELFRK